MVVGHYQSTREEDRIAAGFGTPRHVEKVRAELGPRGVTAELGDARELPLPDDSFDVALVLGPLIT